MTVLLTADEAAAFLKVSKSTIYQRRDIPRYRLPGSRAIRFDETKLLAWAKGGLVSEREKPRENVDGDEPARSLDNGNTRGYHRNALYRDTCEADRL